MPVRALPCLRRLSSIGKDRCMRECRTGWLVCVLVALPCFLDARQAQRTPSRPAVSVADRQASALGAGWTALGAGRTDTAEQAADEVLRTDPDSHAALELKIRAASLSTPTRALDAYEAWLVRARTEDAFVLRPVAAAVLEQIASGPDPGLHAQALMALQGAGVTGTAERLKETVQTATPAGALQLALAGNADAAARLLEPKVSSSLPPQALANGLGFGGAGGIPALRALLKNAAGPVRCAAALSLGKIGATDAIPDLKSLMNDPECRAFAAVALTRLGEAEGEPVVQQLLTSPVLDGRLLGAEAYDHNVPGPWVEALMPLLEDPNGLNRIRAAEMLSTVAPQAARAALMLAASDPNPVVRAEVSRALDTPGIAAGGEPMDPSIPSPSGSETISVAMLRKMLRDPDAATRLHGASALLRLTTTR